MARMQRREFLAGVAAGGVAWACGDNHDGGRFAGLTMAIQSWTFRAFSLEQTLGYIAQLGLTRVELTPHHFAFPATDEAIVEMRNKLASYGLDCVTWGVEWVGADPEANRAVFEYASKLGLHTIGVDPPPESLDSLDALVQEYDLRIGIHNHGPGSRYNRIADVEAALAGRDHRIGCIIDTGHFLRSGEDPIAALRTFEGRVYGVHLKDVAAADPAAPNTIVGEGVLDLVGVFRALRNIGFPRDASLSLEYEANHLAPYDDVVVALEHTSAAAHATA
jgi:inosose dehydratase